MPYTPAWAEKITGVPREQIIKVAREFALNAEKTKGRSMVIIGAAMNHWYHMDMNYRGVINMLVMCGCVGQSGGGWSHYVGPGEAAPAVRLAAARLRARLEPAAAPDELDLASSTPTPTSGATRRSTSTRSCRRPRRPGAWDGALIDYNVRAERMGWLPSAPQLETNPLEVGASRPRRRARSRRTTSPRR